MQIISFREVSIKKMFFSAHLLPYINDSSILILVILNIKNP